MTLEEYEKLREERRRALLSTKPEERKVDLDKEFGSMLQLSNKKGNDEIFIKLVHSSVLDLGIIFFFLIKCKVDILMFKYCVIRVLRRTNERRLTKKTK